MVVPIIPMLMMRLSDSDISKLLQYYGKVEDKLINQQPEIENYYREYISAPKAEALKIEKQFESFLGKDELYFLELCIMSHIHKNPTIMMNIKRDAYEFLCALNKELKFTLIKKWEQLYDYQPDRGIVIYPEGDIWGNNSMFIPNTPKRDK